MTGSELRRWREAHGLSQRRLAKLLHVSNSAVSRWESETDDPDRKRDPPDWLRFALPQIEVDLKTERETEQE